MYDKIKKIETALEENKNSLQRNIKLGKNIQLSFNALRSILKKDKTLKRQEVVFYTHSAALQRKR